MLAALDSADGRKPARLRRSRALDSFAIACRVRVATIEACRVRVATIEAGRVRVCPFAHRSVARERRRVGERWPDGIATGC